MAKFLVYVLVTLLFAAIAVIWIPLIFAVPCLALTCFWPNLGTFLGNLPANIVLGILFTAISVITVFCLAGSVMAEVFQKNIFDFLEEILHKPVANTSSRSI